MPSARHHRRRNRRATRGSDPSNRAEASTATASWKNSLITTPVSAPSYREEQRPLQRCFLCADVPHNASADTSSAKDLRTGMSSVILDDRSSAIGDAPARDPATTRAFSRQIRELLVSPDAAHLGVAA